MHVDIEKKNRILKIIQSFDSNQKLNSTRRYNISIKIIKQGIEFNFLKSIHSKDFLIFPLHPSIFECLEIASLFFFPIPYTKRCRCFCSIGQEFCWKNSVTNQWLFPATHPRHPSIRSMDPRLRETRFAGWSCEPETSI